KVSRVLFNRITEKQWGQHEEAIVSYANLKASIDQYYNESIAHKNQTNKLVEASMSSLDRSNTTISDLYKGLNVITKLLKNINTYHAFNQEEASTAWMKSSTNMAWNLGSRMFGVELSQTALKREISYLKKDTSEINGKRLDEFFKSKYERLKKVPKELGIHYALPAPVPKQASSRSLGRKQKHMELEPETRIPGLECNRSLPKNVPFVNNMVIEEPEYGIFFTDEFGDQAFQRWSDIDKVWMEALVSYLVAASMFKSSENARFSMKLRKLIAEHPDQEKLKSKKVTLKALVYKMD
nr:hypothetical protein [Tanacetum cinerariifolium]